MSEAAAMDQEDDLALTSLPSAGIYTYSQASACRGYQSHDSVVTSSLRIEFRWMYEDGRDKRREGSCYNNEPTASEENESSSDRGGIEGIGAGENGQDDWILG